MKWIMGTGTTEMEVKQILSNASQKNCITVDFLCVDDVESVTLFTFSQPWWGNLWNSE